MSATRLTGACLCGTVQFALSGPYRWFAHCHCSLCRKGYGSLLGTSLGVGTDRFRFLAGTESIVGYRTSAAFARPFCGRCGSRLPSRAQDGSCWNVPAGLVAGELGERPRTHIFVASKAACFTITDDLPRHAEYPPKLGWSGLENSPQPARTASLEGSCLCGALAFEAADTPSQLFHCHCSLCRRSRGAAFASTLAVRRDTFRWRRRGPLSSYALPAPRRYRNDFCVECGSPAPLDLEGMPAVLIPAGSVTSQLPVLPAVHYYVASKAPWYTITDEWPQFTHSG